MPKFSRKSLANLESCHEDLQIICHEVVKIFDCSVLCGYRGEEDQNKMFATNRSKVKWPNSKHNEEPSMAVDIVPYPVNWENSEKNIRRYYYFAGHLMGIAAKLLEEGRITHKVRWGGDWKRTQHFMDQHFDDLAHFELI